ncbi:MAG: hypothetical protein GF364_03155 [Candidatus Lokiarchaeota archaeon]|nr:hypothetical protein [Candidatus Lokiarchaeota archaeon]
MVLQEKYPFIRDDVFLIAQVDDTTGRQHLLMQKVNPKTNGVEFEDKIECIHTAITTITGEHYEEIQDDPDKMQKLEGSSLHIRSSEKLTEINLSAEERFLAMKSWAQGIAEAGLDSLGLQSEIEQFGKLAYPIVNFLLRFLAKVDEEFLIQYLDWIEKNCVLNNTIHEPSFHANLDVVLDLLKEGKFKHKEDILSRIFELDLSSYKTLDLSKMHLTSIPENIRSLTSLETLDIRENRLNTIPDSIGSLKSLTNLNLRKNKLSSLPDSIGSLTSLETLYLYDNKLNSLPETIGSLKSLEELYLKGNKLSSLPESIGSLISLKELDLRKNNLSSLPDSIGSLKSLKYLYLQENKLSSLPGRIKKELKTLKDNGCAIYGVDL